MLFSLKGGVKKTCGAFLNEERDKGLAPTPGQ
jgi:hypothetical protein